MDPYSAEGELINIHNYFHQGQFQEVVDYDTSALSAANGPAARILQLRARVALGDALGVYKEVRGESDPALLAIGALAEQSAGRTESSLATIESLQASASDNATVQVVGGTVLASAGKADEAIALLSQHDASLDAVALIVQIHLSQNRNDLALKEVVAARRWAQDSLLVNLAESWVGVRVGGERYQQAFYVFEELAQSPASSSARTLVAQAVSELHLGRTEEAQAALEQALKADPASADAVANLLVLSVLSGGSETAEATASLKTLDAAHPLLADLEDKSELFDKAASKYAAKAAA